MRTFAFVPTQSLQTKYYGWLNKYRKHLGTIDLLKIGILFGFFLFSVFIYLYYVNLSSTRGYFLRKENQNLSSTSFQYDILKTNILEHKQDNWKHISNYKYQNDIIDLSVEVVYVPDNSDVALR